MIEKDLIKRGHEYIDDLIIYASWRENVLAIRKLEHLRLILSALEVGYEEQRN